MKPLAVLIMTLMGLALALPAAAQQRQISGTVRGPQNQPLTLASVTVVATNRAVGTDAEGNFRLLAPEGPVELRVVALGYKTVDVIVPADQSSVVVDLETDVLNLEGLVVTGQATTVERRLLANAVSTVTPEMIETAPPAQSIEKIMQGQIPGALIEQNSGAPGGGIAVRLRGVSTIIGESEPLYVIDGMVVSNVAIASNANAVTAASGGSNPSLTQDNLVNRIADILPQDIERIEVLKGASAAALYGSRAANGVIIITTKKGTPGSTRVSFTQKFGTYDLSEKFGFRMNWDRASAMATFGLSDAQADQFFSGNEPRALVDHEELLAGENDLSFETSASVSGGDGDTRYFASFTWRDDKGIIRNTGYEKQGIRLNLTQNIGDRFQLTANTNLIHSLAQRGLTNNDNSGTSFYMTYASTPTFWDPRPNAQGVFPENPFERSNPLQTASQVSNDEEVFRLIGGLNGEFDVFDTPTQSLRLLGTFGIDFFNQENDLFFPPGLEFEDDDGLPGTSLLGNSNNREMTINSSAVYEYTPQDASWNSTTTAGFQFGSRELNTSRVESFGLTAGQPSLASGVVKNIRENRQKIKDLSFFAQEELLLLDERLLLTGGFTTDRSSVNADPDEFFFYPKASASFRFDDVTSWLSGLKLRTAWGQSGNQPLFGQKFTPLTATSNIDGLPGVIVQGTVAAPDLQPERQEEFEIGFDATLFNESAQLEATFFQKNVTDLLLQRTPAPSTGFATEIFNGGELEVTGIELALSATAFRRGDFSWITRTTFYHDESEIVDLPVPPFETGGFGVGLGAFRIEEGRSATQIVGTIGVDADGNDIVAPLGDATPDFRMSFSNDFTYKSLRLASLWDWSKGNSVVNLTQLLFDAFGNASDAGADPITCPVIGADVDPATCRILTWAVGNDVRPYVERASYAKLRELSLTWDLPENTIQSLFGRRVDNASITLSGRDLITITDYGGVDPEVSNFGNQPIARNIDVAPFPPSRSFWLSVNVVF